MPCLCATLRKAARSSTALYDAFLRPAGIRTTQYSLLVNVGRNPGISVGRLGELLVMDQTTATRNLQTLAKAGYVRLDPSNEDKRIRLAHVTPEGADKIAQTRPYWEQAQAAMVDRLGGRELAELFRIVAPLLQEPGAAHDDSNPGDA